MKIIIFGRGKIYNERRGDIPKDVEILGIIDNNDKFYGQKADGIEIFPPGEVKNYHYDCIVLMSDFAVEMKEQLLHLGCRSEKIIHYKDFFGLFPCEIKKYAGIENNKNLNRKTLLIVSVALLFNGVPIVSLLTAKVTKKSGYSVTIAADAGDSRYIDEAVGNGIRVLICENLKHMSAENLEWTNSYDIVLINSLPMLHLAVKISRKREVLVWVHESSAEYRHMEFWREELQKELQKKEIKMYAPSERAKRHFIQYFHVEKQISIVPLGIEDKNNSVSLKKQICYGVIGALTYHKGQDIFMSAVEALSDDIVEKSFFLLIGKKDMNDFSEKIVRRASMINNCILLGERTQQEIQNLYERLDIVVVASREETVSMVAIEAMMMGKVCIVSNETGIAEYIVHEKNGFVFQNENENELASIMRWCYQNQQQLKIIGTNARKTYEENFSMHRFSMNIQNMLHK